MRLWIMYLITYNGWYAMFVCLLVGFYGISTFVGYLMSGPFLYK